MPSTIMMARESWRWQMLTLVRSHIGCSVTWNILVARKKKCFLLKDLAQMKPLLTRKSASSFKCTVRRQWTSQRFHAATNQKRRSIGPPIFRISSWGIFLWLRKTLNWKIVKFPPQRRPVGGWVFSFVRIYGLWSRSFAFKSDTGCSWCWFFCFELPSAFLLGWNGVKCYSFNGQLVIWINLNFPLFVRSRPFEWFLQLIFGIRLNEQLDSKSADGRLESLTF